MLLNLWFHHANAVTETQQRVWSSGGGGDAGQGFIRTPKGWVKAAKYRSVGVSSLPVWPAAHFSASLSKPAKASAFAYPLSFVIKSDANISFVDKAVASGYTMTGMPAVRGEQGSCQTVCGVSSRIEVETLGADEIFAILEQMT